MPDGVVELESGERYPRGELISTVVRAYENPDASRGWRRLTGTERNELRDGDRRAIDRAILDLEALRTREVRRARSVPSDDFDSVPGDGNT